MKKEDHWPTDGHDHHIIARNAIYENGKISSFLDSNRINLVIASKGMGKTLLMRVKKKIVIDSDDDALLIPKNDEEFDEPKLHGTLSRTGFTSVSFWKDIWTVASVLSILTHIQGKFDDFEGHWYLEHIVGKFEIDGAFKQELLENIHHNARLLPSEYLARLLLSYSENELNDFLRSVNTADELSRQFIGSAVYIFIDGFDQTLTEAFCENREAWKAGQRGLAKAAHTLFTKNHHVKVFATIRQEAWSGFKDDDREVIKGKSIILDHSDRDLRSIFEKAVSCYTDKKSLERFFGVTAVHNCYCCDDEDPLNYISRHSTGTPRSLMYFGKAIDELDLHTVDDPKARMTELRDKVDKIAAENVFSDYLAGQKQMFLDTLLDDERLRTLIELIPSNVLTADSLKSIKKEFCRKAQIPEDSAHPFCELYNIGLLGQVRQDPTEHRDIQYFRKPYEFDWKQSEILRRDALYLIHPGLSSAISGVRDLRINCVNVIGARNQWKSKKGALGFCKNGIPIVFISHSSIDKHNVRALLIPITHEINLRFPADIWFDEWKIQPGEYIQCEVEHAAAKSDVVVLFASKASLSSPWVEKEWKSKVFGEIEGRSINVIVALIDDTKTSDLPEFLKNKLALRVDIADQDAVARLANSICEHAAANLAHEFPPNT